MARILAVDDERAILDALARVLGRDGHEVVRAADPTAVPGMDLSRFDLVLCDVMMWIGYTDVDSSGRGASAHGGSVSLANGPSGGAVATIAVPLCGI